MPNALDNMNPKRNPVTSILGGVFITISAVMLCIQYIVPAFFVLKQEIPFTWYAPFIPLAIGILLVFINDDYFARIFNRADRITAKRTETEDKIVNEIKIEKDK